MRVCVCVCVRVYVCGFPDDEVNLSGENVYIVSRDALLVSGQEVCLK